jgi:hypothetical protein
MAALNFIVSFFFNIFPGFFIFKKRFTFIQNIIDKDRKRKALFMPLKLISSFISLFLRRGEELVEQKESPASITFSPTITIQGLWSKKDDLSDITTVKSSAESERWIAHQEQLLQIQNQVPLFDPNPTTDINDYELIETLGK